MEGGGIRSPQVENVLNRPGEIGLRYYEKMADVDIDPETSDHNKTNEHTNTGESIPVNPGGVGKEPLWEPECEQEISFGGRKTPRKKVHQFLHQQFVQGAI